MLVRGVVVADQVDVQVGRHLPHFIRGCCTSKLRPPTAGYDGENGYTIVYPLWYGSAMALKDSGMRIRVEKDLREAFVRACRLQDRHAADVLRNFMRTFTEKQLQGQAGLFAGSKRKQK